MINSSIERQSKWKKYREHIMQTRKPSFKDLSKEWKMPRIKKVALPDLTIYPKDWTYLVSNDKHPHTLTIDEFRKKKLKKGDKIYFERGQIYNWSQYDVSDDNLTFGSFGSGADPVFYGSSALTVATSEAGGYYSGTLATAPLWVTIGGVCVRQGETAWIPSTANATTTNITGSAATLNAFNSVEVLAGNAKLRHKEYNFRLSFERNVTGYNTGTGVLTTTGSGDIEGGASGMPFKLYGQKQYATLQNDWWYDDPNNKLWIKSSTAPSNVRVITQNYAFKVEVATGCTFENLDFTQYYETAIDAPDAPSITVNNVDVHDNRTNGLMFYGNNTSFTLTNFSIERCGLNGVHIGAVSSATISDFTIEDIGIQDNIGWPINTYWIKTGGTALAFFWDSGEAITQPTDVDVSSGTMSNLGYQGTHLLGDNHNWTEVIVHDFGLRWNDGGAFHSIHRIDRGTSTKNVTYTRCVAYNGLGAFDGITSNEVNDASGFYVDNGCELFTINECISYNNAGRGMICNWDTQKTTITDCIIFGNVESGILYRQDTDPVDSPVFTNNDGNILTGNLIVYGDVNRYCVEIESYNGDATYNPFSDSGDSNNNTYVRPYGSSINASRSTANGTITAYAIAAWRTRISDDAASTERYETSYTYKNPIKARALDVRIAVNATGSPISVNATGYHSVAGVSLGSSETVAAWSALVYLIDTQATPDYLQDKFTAANGTAIAGRAPAVGPIPTIGSGTHSIQSNEMVSTSGGPVYWGISQANFDFTVRTRTSNITDGLNTYFRRVNDNNRMVITISATLISLIEFNNSASATNTWTKPYAFVAGADYFISVRANGTSVQIWASNVLLLDITTAYTTAGQVGFNSTLVRATDYILAESI